MFEFTPAGSRHVPLPSLVDAQGRGIDYLRLAVTDHCNLRCRYCMPAGGVAAAGRAPELSDEEILRLAGLLCDRGIRRIRITGGEPLMRRGVTDLIAALAALPAKPEVLLTTNGILLTDHLDALKAAGVRRINLSLDSLDKDKWERITRRLGHDRVLKAMDRVLDEGLGLKINVVVMPGVNDDELVAFANLTRAWPATVRFIEAMGFDGSGRPVETMSGSEIVRRLRTVFDLRGVARPVSAVADEFMIAGHQGRIGIINGHRRTFCADCSRLRIDARGQLRTCLYGVPQVDLKGMLRSGAADEDILAAVHGALARRKPDGFAAQAVQLDSMASIGG